MFRKPNKEPNITISSCWYIFKSKFNVETYMSWIHNMLSTTNNYFLVIYSDLSSSLYLGKYVNNPKIKIIIKPFNQFYNYKYKDYWIANHEKNFLLKEQIDWKVNMLWCEKIHFVNETMKRRYFPATDFYGWCDIGYFRNDHFTNNIDKRIFTRWPDPQKLNRLDYSTIYYACVNNDTHYIKSLFQRINTKNAVGLPIKEIPSDQTSIAGGFFIAYKDKIDWWRETFDNKLKLYFENGYLVKDDQIIIADCVFSNMGHFKLITENTFYDNWFVFLRYLL